MGKKGLRNLFAFFVLIHYENLKFWKFLEEEISKCTQKKKKKKKKREKKKRRGSNEKEM